MKNPIPPICLYLVTALTVPAAVIESLTELRAERSRLATKPGRLIMNNDGCDCLYFPRTLAATPENFLQQRMTALAGTQVDSIAYCSISSGFAQFTHETKTGRSWNTRPRILASRPTSGTSRGI